jgi:hypothetical protein
VSEVRSVAVLAGALAVGTPAAWGDVPVPPTTSRADRQTAPESLSLVWIDVTSAAAGSESPACAEAARLLASMGVIAEWRMGRAGETVQPRDLRVILLDRAAADREGKPVLGSTPEHFAGERYVWVHVPGVRGAVGLDPRRRLDPSEVRDRLVLGRALGRVIAHEVVHAVAPGVPHGSGLMARCLDKRDLTAKVLTVPAEVGPAFRAALFGDDAKAVTEASSGTLLFTVGGRGR